MMFNGLLLCNDSDTSEFTKDSTGASGSEGEARARSLEDSLLAAARALQNKEETVRVQAESLALAEERLAVASRIRNCANGSHFDVTEISTITQSQDNREIVKTLQDNLSVIEDLYRECFYETARQDEMIAALRASCRGATPSAPAPLGRTLVVPFIRDVALQVEHLKAEISNFLNNSTNHDSVLTNAVVCRVSTNVVDKESGALKPTFRMVYTGRTL